MKNLFKLYPETLPGIFIIRYSLAIIFSIFLLAFLGIVSVNFFLDSISLLTPLALISLALLSGYRNPSWRKEERIKKTEFNLGLIGFRENFFHIWVPLLFIPLFLDFFLLLNYFLGPRNLNSIFLGFLLFNTLLILLVSLSFFCKRIKGHFIYLKKSTVFRTYIFLYLITIFLIINYFINL